MNQLEIAKKGYYPTWSHYLQGVWSDMAWGTTLYIGTGDTLRSLVFCADFFVNHLPKVFQEKALIDPYYATDLALVFASIWCIHPKAGTSWRKYIWITRKGGIFRKSALPTDEMTREIFLVTYLRDIEKWHEQKHL